jgi:hypothetical protein
MAASVLRKRRHAVLAATLLAAGMLLSAPLVASAATVRTIPASVPANCSSDVTAQFQSYLGTVADGDTIQFPAGACYRLDGTLRVTDRHDLTFVGMGLGATLRQVTLPAATPKIEHTMIDTLGGSGLTFQNLTLQSTNNAAAYNVDREWYAGFEIEGTSAVLIDNVHGEDLWGDFVQVDPDTRPATDVMATGVTVQNSSADHVGRHAFSCGGCDYVTFDRNTISDVGYHAFDLEVEASWWHASNVRFSNNTITGYLHLGVVANAGVGSYVTNVTITGNNDTAATLRTCQPPVQVVDTEPIKDHWTISNNNFQSLGVGFDIAGVDYVTAQNNVLQLRHGGCTNQTAATKVAATSHDILSGNDFQGADRLVQAGAALGAGSSACGNRLSMIDPNFNKPAAC